MEILGLSKIENNITCNIRNLVSICTNYISNSVLLIYITMFSIRYETLPVTRPQILAYARRSGPLSREGSLSCHTYCDTGPRFIRSYPKDRHPRPTVGFEPPMQGSSDRCARRSNHCATLGDNFIVHYMDVCWNVVTYVCNLCAFYLNKQ
jgi:hypothetical protein